MSIINKFFRSYIISSALLSNKYLYTTTKPQIPERMSSTHLTEFSVAYVTTPNSEVAKQIAQKLVETHLCACVNIIPGITSIYEWKGKIETDSEVLMMIKTRTSIIEQLIRVVKDNHPYEVCEVITVPIQHGNKPYLDWLSETVPKP